MSCAPTLTECNSRLRSACMRWSCSLIASAVLARAPGAELHLHGQLPLQLKAHKALQEQSKCCRGAPVHALRSSSMS